MGKIKILSEEVANRIAAGEVIERPASVVKECVENSIDACASEIIVTLANGGKDLIQITDNGLGMSEEDAFICFERHATSKIKTVDDITHINTMGFRGEALPSIASISHFLLITKTAEDEVATEISFAGGKLNYMKKTSARTGTTISVKNIFYNIPARRKFLKSEPVEYKHILNYIHYQSILFPHISFKLIHNQKEKLNYPATDSIEKRMLDIFGTSFSKQHYIYLENQINQIGIFGYIQDIEKPEPNFSNDVHYIFVNRRFINDKTIYSAIKNAYEPFLKKYRFFEHGKLPNYILFINIIPEEIDVNVHPAKTEIRLRNAGAVYQYVKQSVLDCLNQAEHNRYNSTKEKISSIPSDTPLTYSEQEIVKDIYKVPSPPEKKTDNVDIIENSLQNLFSFKNDTQEYDKPKSNIESRYQAPTYKEPIHFNQQNSTQYEKLIDINNEPIQIFQMHNTYIFIEVEDGYCVIDQHAAHERINYEKLLKSIEENNPNKQKLLFPLIIDLPKYLAENMFQIINENLEIFNKLGFTIKTFSGNSLAIDEIPSSLSNWDGGDVFLDILKQLQEELTQTKDFRIASAASVACKASIKAGQKLSKREMQELIKELFTCETPFYCPHGRPLIFKMTLNEIEKRFKRIV